MPSYPLSQEEFAQEQQAGQFSATCTYEDYLAVIRDREKMLRELQEAARRDGFELIGAQPPELTDEDERILDRAWQRLAEEKAQAEPIAA